MGSWSLPFGLEIKKSTDVLAFAAFLISITTLFLTLIIQVVSFSRGALLIVYPSRYVLLIAHQYQPNESEIVLRIGLPMNYVNKGAVGYDAAIKTEFVEFILGKKRYRQEWQAVSYFTARLDPEDCTSERNKVKLRKLKNKQSTLTGWAATNDARDLIYNCQNIDEKLIVKEKDDPVAGVVKAGGAVSHETYFEPVKQRCTQKSIKENTCDIFINRLSWKQFLETIKPGEKIKFEMGIETFDGDRVSSQCLIDVSRRDKTWLERAGWRKFDCWEVSTNLSDNWEYTVLQAQMASSPKELVGFG